MAIPKRVENQDMDTSEAPETPEFQGGYVDVNTKGPGRPIQIRPNGTQSNDDIVNQAPSTSSFSKFSGVTSFGENTSKLAENITVLRDGVLTKRDREDHSRALDRPKAAERHIPPDGPSTSRQNSVKNLHLVGNKTKPNESKRKRSKDPGDQDCPIDSKVLRVNHLDEAPKYVKAGGQYFEVKLSACGSNIPSTSATQKQRRPSLHQGCNVDRPPENGDTGDVNEPLNLSSRPLDLSTDPKVMIGEPSLVAYGEDQQTSKCTIVASVEDPQYTESTMEESDDGNVDKRPGPENAGELPDADEDDVPASRNPDATFNLPALEILTLENKPSKSPIKKKKEKKDIFTMLKDGDITLEKVNLLMMYCLGKRMQRSATGTEGTTNAVEGPSTSSAGEGPSTSSAGEGPSTSSAGEGPRTSSAGEGPRTSSAGEGPSTSSAVEGPRTSFAVEGPRTSSACEGAIPDFSTLQIETAVTPHEQLMTVLKDKVTNRS